MKRRTLTGKEKENVVNKKRTIYWFLTTRTAPRMREPLILFMSLSDEVMGQRGGKTALGFVWFICYYLNHWNEERGGKNCAFMTQFFSYFVNCQKWWGGKNWQLTYWNSALPFHGTENMNENKTDCVQPCFSAHTVQRPRSFLLSAGKTSLAV